MSESVRDETVAVTVVVTTYNIVNYIDKCIEELLKQTLSRFEILIIDDASTDGTKEKVEMWAEMHPEKIKTVVLEDNLGKPALTRNCALDSGLITGQYVIFLDGDDTIAPNILEKMYNSASSKKKGSIFDTADVVICAYDRIAEDTGKLISKEMCGKFPSFLDRPSSTDLIAYINTAPWNKLWKYEVIKDVRFSNCRVGEEIIFSFNVYRESRRIDFLDEILIHYFVRTVSLISNTNIYDIWSLAEELRLYSVELSGIEQEIMEEIVFIHIGLSMGVRAMDFDKKYLKTQIENTRCYFRDNYHWFRECRFLKFRTLFKKGVKGMAIWLALWMYRTGTFSIALSAYKRLGMNVKF